MVSTSKPASKKLKLIVGIVIVSVVPILPGLIAVSTSLQSVTGTWALAALAITLSTMFAGIRIGILVALCLTIASFFGYLAAGNPWLAMIVMGISAGLYGLSSGKGLNSAIAMAPIALGFIMAERTPIVDSANTVENALFTALVVLAASLWSAPIGWFMSSRLPEKVRHAIPRERAHIFAIVIALVSGMGMWLAIQYNWKHGGAWFIMTLFVVIQPYLRDTWKKSLQRGLGTTLGFGIAYVVSVSIKAEWLLYVVGLVFLTVSVGFLLSPKHNYWQYTAAITPGIVIMEGTGTSIVTTDVQRLQFTMLGVAIALIAVAVLEPFFGKEEKKELAAKNSRG